ncbi:autotransporter domain-containing protein, partial [Trinickia sp. YCB016]
ADGYSANYGGLLFGADKAVGERWRAGGAFSFTTTAVNNTGDSAGDSTRVNAYGLFGYASYTAPKWYANLSAGAVLQHYDTTRVVDFTGFSGTAQGQFSGQQYVAQAEAGYPIALGAYTLTPLTNLTYSYLHQNAYTESGGSGAALSVGAAHASSVTSDLGVKLERGFGTAYGVLVPDVRLAWRHEYVHGAQLTSSRFAADASGETTFTTTGASPVSDLAVA